MNPEPIEAAVAFQGVCAGYRGAPVLNDVTFSLAPGDMAAVLGPNGAGKSTLLRVLTGLLPATRGTARLFGRDVGARPAVERARLVAVVPQELETPMPFTVAEMAAMGRTAARGRWRAPSAEDRAAIERAMVYTDVIDLQARSYNELSGGEKQRVVVAMALAQEPRLIVMDEPTSHLDINHRLEIMQIVERLNAVRGVTVLMTSHDLNLAAEFCRRLLVLDRGRIVADGGPREVLREDLLREVYACEMRVQADDYGGGVLVTPARRLNPREGGRAARLHVVAGGGCGEEALRRLSLCGYRLSCGVLNRQDTDALTADALGAEAALEQPFSPIGAESLARARALAGTAEAVIVCEVPFGAGNLANLALAEQALEQGKPVLVNTRHLPDRDFTSGQAADRVAALVRGGATPWQHPAELVDLLDRALGARSEGEGERPR